MITHVRQNTRQSMNKDDIDNLKAIIIRSQNGSLDEWFDTLTDEELKYALTLLLTLNASRQAFVDSTLT